MKMKMLKVPLVATISFLCIPTTNRRVARTKDWEAFGVPRFGFQPGFYPSASKRLNLPLRPGTFLPLAHP